MSDKHPLFTKAKGYGAQRIEVRLVPVKYATMPDREGVLLAVLDGADMNVSTRDGQWAVARIESRHKTATDFEHDTAKVAMMEVAGLSLLSMHGPETRYVGTLIEARLYPHGVDPLQTGDADTDPGDCDGTYPQWNAETKTYDNVPNHDPHPFAAYLPPERAEIDALCPSIVTITITPKGTKR